MQFKNTLRQNRILCPDGRSLIVALDHFPSGFMEGWEYPEATLEKVLDGGPDAILANFGILKRFAPILAGKVGTIMRLDGGPTYLLEQWPDCSRWEALYSVEDAVYMGVDAVIASILVGGKAEVDSVQVASRIAADCLKYNMPCVIHAVPAESVTIKSVHDPERIAFASRLAAEIGADVVNTYYSGDAESFKRITQRCPIPVLTAGGLKVNTDRQLLEMVEGVLDGGGHGLFIGRNVWQHDDPPAILQALRRLIHDDETVDEAMQELDY